jgi:hypothetical protein
MQRVRCLNASFKLQPSSTWTQPRHPAASPGCWRAAALPVAAPGLSVHSRRTHGLEVLDGKSLKVLVVRLAAGGGISDDDVAAGREAGSGARCDAMRVGSS